MAEVMLAGDVGMIWSWQVVVLHMMSMACGGNTHDGSWHVVVLHDGSWQVVVLHMMSMVVLHCI